MFSHKLELTPAARGASTTNEEAHAPVGEDSPQEVMNNIRYNVCQTRTSPVDRPSTVGDIVETQKINVKQAIEQQHLQPAMLPEYYQQQMERSVLLNPQPEPTENDRIQGNQIATR